MSRYPLGQPVRVSTTIRQLNTDGTTTPVNASTLTLVVKLAAADGTFVVTGTYASPVNDGTGLYHQDIPAADLAAIGHYQYAWTSTGTGAGVAYGDFDVVDPFEAGEGTLYCTIEELKSRLQITSARDDLEVTIAAEAASRAIDGYTERYFYRIADTRTYVPQDLYRCRTDDLVSVTSLATDPAGTTAQGGTFPVAWPAGSFQLLPYNPRKSGEQRPYTSIRAVGGLTFPWVTPLPLTRMDRVQVTGVFGWPAVPQAIRTATLIAAAELFRMKDTPAGGGEAGEFSVVMAGQNPRIGKLAGPYCRNPFLTA